MGIMHSVDLVQFGFGVGVMDTPFWELGTIGFYRSRIHQMKLMQIPRILL